ncbi:unnamed protein product [Rotaria sp. Silwood1]|nr:unnamed protein product [Rotaria sp. Silwood1]CAF1283215.1 unnamed protein product [Rotaria sp. Silwood1]CAF3493299.1 unnamed protein product [Rotaria sp. Silwood1]CAF3514086.1 unnamed protein product [Rotaria sp. Silwood1]CAF4830149.1 unnamed protein product [Rotaria sp. Silwood1]
MASKKQSYFIRQERIPVSSAIPSATLNLFSLPRRPASTNSSGQRNEYLLTNHFSCEFVNNLPLYQYDVSIEELGSCSGEWFEVKGRSRCARIMQSLISNGRFHPQVVIWYDEQKCLYSTSLLTSPQLITNTDGRNRLNIKLLANQWSTNDIHNYINGQANVYPFDAVRILETLLKKSLQDRVEVVNNTCYFSNELPKKLSGGFEERFGFIQALNLASGRLTLNIQTKLTTFYPEINLLDFIHMQIGAKRIPNENECKKLNRVLKNCLVVTRQSNWKQAYEIDQFDHRRPVEIKIESGETLVEYFKNAKNIALNQTNYPCIQVYIPNEYNKPCHLPLEVCRIQAWQVYDKPLSKAQEAQQPRKCIPKPNERYAAIMDVLKKCNYNSPSNRLCREVGFQIKDEQMLTLNAQLLTQPQIHTGPNCKANVRIGRIPLDGHLFTPKPISALAVAYFGTDPAKKSDLMNDFLNTLLNVMKSYHVDVKYEKHTVPPTNDQINEYFLKMSERKCQFVICIMDGKSEDDLKQLKAYIKDCGTVKYGVMTQCVLLLKIEANRSLTSYCENLIRKINYKNSGINTKVNLNEALKYKKSQKDSYMFFGADVIHPTNVTRQHPSIAAVVGSGDSLCSTTAVRVCQQYPKEGKCSIETIIGMTDMVKQLLDYYRQANKVLPNKIVFYRDGVDDGQFGKVIAHEIPAICQAFDLIYGDKSNHPLLTFIVVKKRHNTRFFNYNASTKQMSNMSIGTVIDTTIVHPYQNNFYLNSHNAFQGVNHPSLYHVLLDEIGFTANELQLLTYHLCFTDPRSSASEAIPSVVHQADIAAFKARDLFYDDEHSSATSVGGRSQPLLNPNLNDVDYKILDVHENLKNRPVFG